MKLAIFVGVLLLLSVAKEAKKRELNSIEPDENNLIEVTQYNFDEVLEFVKSKNGTLFLHPYKEHCGACNSVQKNFKELAKMIKKNKSYREKFFIAECNLSKNIELENKYFLGPMPKVYYFSAFENMRKRKYERITTPHLILQFLLSLKPQEPKRFTTDMNFNLTMKQINEHHMILGLFPNGKDETYRNQFIEASNKYSHLPFYA